MKVFFVFFIAIFKKTISLFVYQLFLFLFFNETGLSGIRSQTVHMTCNTVACFLCPGIKPGLAM